MSLPEQNRPEAEGASPQSSRMSLTTSSLCEGDKYSASLSALFTVPPDLGSPSDRGPPSVQASPTKNSREESLRGEKRHGSRGGAGDAGEASTLWMFRCPQTEPKKVQMGENIRQRSASEDQLRDASQFLPAGEGSSEPLTGRKSSSSLEKLKVREGPQRFGYRVSRWSRFSRVPFLASPSSCSRTSSVALWKRQRRLQVRLKSGEGTLNPPSVPSLQADCLPGPPEDPSDPETRAPPARRGPKVQG